MAVSLVARRDVQDLCARHGASLQKIKAGARAPVRGLDCDRPGGQTGKGCVEAQGHDNAERRAQVADDRAA